MTTISLNRYPLTAMGWLFIALGLLANQWVLTFLFSNDGQIGMRYRVLIWTFQLVLIAAGVILLRIRNGIRMPSNVLANIALLVGAVVFTLIGAELVLRVAGFQPYRIVESNVATKSGEGYFTQHPTLGYSQLPGEFDIAMGDDYVFHTTHEDSGLRATHHPVPVDGVGGEQEKEEIWVFGGSVTYGWSLNDEETYPWLLQEAFPNYEIVNFGVSGYGPLTNLIQFREALDEGRRPKLVILTYASFHDMRNTGLREWRMFMAGPWNRVRIDRLPYARLDGEDNLVFGMVDNTYTELPLMRVSAFMKMLELGYQAFEHQIHRSHDVSKALIVAFAELAKENEIDFVLAGIWPDELTADVLEFARNKGIPVVDIGVDLDGPGNRNLPYDDHPSAHANIQYAEMLERYLRDTFLATNSK